MATQEELESAKRKAELEKIERQSKVDGWNVYFEFITNKAAGVLVTGFGALEMLSPDIISHNTSNPQYFIAGGLSLLAGRGILKLIKNVTNSFE